ncbi:hypothetical protein DNTS_023621 [Danionella cerebrum]|uniref:Leukocyte receptor cluster member 4 n=1 Tax=Danionella cerebrum TaxID=2873325 RepID=A0A553QHB6_9TELE|nr:hypothetical protein DNTS_023621 [Danionella translucida]
MSPEELVYLGILSASIPVGFLFRFLIDTAGPDLDSNEVLSALLGLRSRTFTQQILNLWTSELTGGEAQMLRNYSCGALTLNSEEPFPELRSSSKAGGGIALRSDYLYYNMWDPHLAFALYSVGNMADYKDQLEECAMSIIGLDFPLSPLFPFSHLVWLSSTNTFCQCHSTPADTKGQMVSLANEVQSYHLERKQEVSSFTKSPVVGGLSHEPSLYDVISYSYCYVGIMTGPFFRYQTYADWLQQSSPLSLPGKEPCLQRLKMVPVYGALFITVNSVFPLGYVRAEEFLEHNYFYRFFYMVAVFFVFRMRFYSAWCGAEAGCISAGLGCYPKGALSKPGGGPTVNYSPDPDAAVEYDFKTIQNIDCYNTDFCVKVRHGMRYWNMTVQWWLHHYIYPNAPFRSYALRAGWTMLISAYWHGLHAGYYLSFLTIPLCIAAETAMEASIRAHLGPVGQKTFDWIHWFLKMRAYDYMCMGFVLLKAGDTINYWSSIYFVIHIVAVVCIAVGQCMKGGSKKERRE